HGGALDLRAVPRPWLSARGVPLRRRLRAGGDRHRGFRHVGAAHGVSGVGLKRKIGETIRRSQGTVWRSFPRKGQALRAWKADRDVVDVLASRRHSSAALTKRKERGDRTRPGSYTQS